MHSASKEKIMSEVAGATQRTIRQLKNKRILIEETGVQV
jgi:hypothetical protein